MMEEINALYGNVLDELNKYKTFTYKTINTTIVIPYWQIGKAVVENERGRNVKALYGGKMLQSLSKELSTDFDEDFSYSHLRNFRQFYLTYQDDQICYAMLSKSQNFNDEKNQLNYALHNNLSWKYHHLIMEAHLKKTGNK